jgi:hypothetical protein
MVSSVIVSPRIVHLTNQSPLLETDHNVLPVTEVLLAYVTKILFQTNQDVRQLIALARKLIRPLVFSQLQDLAGPDEIMMALESELPAANLIALEILNSAGRNAAKIAVLEHHPEITLRMLSLCFDSEDISVSQTAMDVLANLLATDYGCGRIPYSNIDHALDNDSDHVVNGGSGHVLNGGNGHVLNGNSGRARLPPSSPPGDNILWKQIFIEQEGISTILLACHANNGDTAEEERRVTTAQGRLLEFLPRIVHINPVALSETRFPELFDMPPALAFRVRVGVIQWAALCMIDPTDELMCRQLQDFWDKLIFGVFAQQGSPLTYPLLRDLVRAAVEDDESLVGVFRNIPNQIRLSQNKVEDEAGDEAMRENLRAFIEELLQ